MSTTMTRRERVERTINCKETDRVPYYDLIYCDAAFEYFSGEKLPKLDNSPATLAELNRIAGKATSALVDLTSGLWFGPTVEEDETDSAGIVWRHSPQHKTAWIVERPFSDVPGAVQHVKKNIVESKARLTELKADPAAAREAHRKGFLETQALIGDTVNIITAQCTGLSGISCTLGLELFSYLMADEPGLVSEFLELCTSQAIALCHAVADRELSPVMAIGDDIACKQRLLYSPEFLRNEFFPRLKSMTDAWHEHGIKCLFHSDGYLMDVMDDLLEAGIDGLNPIEIVAGMDIREVRERVGPDFFIVGGVDMSQLLSLGDPDEVRAACRQAVEDAYPGYFLASTTQIDNSCRLENLIAMQEQIHVTS